MVIVIITNLHIFEIISQNDLAGSHFESLKSILIGNKKMRKKIFTIFICTILSSLIELEWQIINYCFDDVIIDIKYGLIFCHK